MMKFLKLNSKSLTLQVTYIHSRNHPNVSLFIYFFVCNGCCDWLGCFFGICYNERKKNNLV